MPVNVPCTKFTAMDTSFSTLEFSGDLAMSIESDFDLLKFKKNQNLYTEGSTPLGVFYLQEGEVLISKLASQGKEQVLRIISKKGLFCCADLLLNKRYSSSARATKDSTAIFVSRTDFLKMISENKDLNHQIIIQLAEEVTSLENQVVSLAYKPLRGRLADKLLSLENSNGEKSAGAIRLSRRDLAGYAGTVKETVNRVLSEFQREEIISISEKQIIIKDRIRLQRLSQMYD